MMPSTAASIGTESRPYMYAGVRSSGVTSLSGSDLSLYSVSLDTACSASSAWLMWEYCCMLGTFSAATFFDTCVCRAQLSPRSNCLTVAKHLGELAHHLTKYIVVNTCEYIISNRRREINPFCIQWLKVRCLQCLPS